MRLAAALAVTVVALTAPMVGGTSAEAGDAQPLPGFIQRPTAPPPARTPSVLRGGDPGIDRFDDRRGDGRPHRPGSRPIIIVPQTVYVNPSNCWQPGYWSYQWVPQTYTYSQWVAGQWSPDGYWIEGHYAPGQYSTGYYQPLWTEGYYSSC